MAARTLEMSLQQILVLVQLRQVWPSALSVLCVQGDTSRFTRMARSQRGCSTETPWIRRKVSTTATLKRRMQETAGGAWDSNFQV